MKKFKLKRKLNGKIKLKEKNEKIQKKKIKTKKNRFFILKEKIN